MYNVCIYIYCIYIYIVYIYMYYNCISPLRQPGSAD